MENGKSSTQATDLNCSRNNQVEKLNKLKTCINTGIRTLADDFQQTKSHVYLCHCYFPSFHDGSDHKYKILSKKYARFLLKHISKDMRKFAVTVQLFSSSSLPAPEIQSKRGRKEYMRMSRS